MNRDISDIIDRFSISKLKAERIGTEDNKKEYEAFLKEVENIKKIHPEYNWDKIINFIIDINKDIWKYEAALKSGKEELPEPNYIFSKKNNEAKLKIADVAILIRDFNHLRVQFKNFINDMLNEGWEDVKSNHLSE